jgi:hypothetical protein
MINIFCGEDVSASRNAFFTFKNEVKGKKIEVINVDATSLKDIPTWLYESQLLFATEKFFFAEGVLSKKENREFIKTFDKKESPHIAIWEGGLTEREVKRYFTNVVIKNFKLPESIFTLLDALYPSNKQNALKLMQLLKGSVEENILLFLLQRYVRELILASGNVFDPKKAPWQTGKLKTQAQKWPQEKLITFYEALFRIEANLKSGQSYYPISKSLDILFCFYL